MTERHPDPGREHAHRIRLDHVIIGARLECRDDAIFHRIRAHDDDRAACPVPYPGAHCEAVDIWQTHVEQDDVERRPSEQIECFGAARRAVDDVATTLESDGQCLHLGPIVLHDEHGSPAEVTAAAIVVRTDVRGD